VVLPSVLPEARSATLLKLVVIRSRACRTSASEPESQKVRKSAGARVGGWEMGDGRWKMGDEKSQLSKTRLSEN